MTIKIFKDNLLVNEKDYDVKDLITEYLKSEYSTREMLFERSFLLFLASNYGSFDRLTDKQWDEIFNTYSELNNA